MKFSLNWLKEHLDTTATLDQVVDRLIMIGLEVEGVEDRAKGLEDFVVANVTAARPHPDADKLQICTVDNGTEISEVVCGAPNARAGMKAVHASAGMYIPGIDLTLKLAKIRGVESNGMLLSEREMGLSDDHEGIVDLPADAPVGARAVDVMGLNDPVIEIAITPNRGDCLGVRGVARDLAASGLGVLKPLVAQPVPGLYESPITVTMDFTPETTDACPQFVGRYIRGVKNGESPQWLKERLLAIGLRPISALVDITNLVTFDLCRPLHVFDVAKVTGDIHVRLAKPGETLMALNGKEYQLDETMTVIADEKQAEALAGVIGGEDTGCTETTTDVFVEAALFDPVRTATTGRKLNLTSDARFRFERGIDPSFLVTGAEIATRLILDLCGGEPSELVIAGAEPDWKRTIDFRVERVRTLAGVETTAEECTDILTRLGCQVSDGPQTMTVTVPPWRNDIEGEACLVEEVVRLKGYDSIPTVSLVRDENLPHPALEPYQRRRVTARRTLAARGLVEAVTYSFVSEAQANLFGGVDPSVRLVNPISVDLEIMRPSLLPNLIVACGRNADRGVPNAALFEVGPQYANDTAKGQDILATGLRSGASGPRSWVDAPHPVDVFDAKADALAVLDALGVPVAKLQVAAEAPDWYHPGRSGVLRLGPKNVLARFGEIHPRVLRALDVKGPVAGFEIFIDKLPRPKVRKSAARPHLELPSFHPVDRDFAFVVDGTVAADDLVRAARGAEKSLIVDVAVFDQFIGPSVGEGKKSVALTVTLQPREKTMTDTEIDAVADKVVAAVAKFSGGVLRS